MGIPLLSPRRLVMTLLLVLAFLAHGTQAQPVRSSSVPNKVVGYYASWAAEARHYPPEAIDAGKLTHINFAFAVLRDGQVVLDEDGKEHSQGKTLERLVALKSRFPALRILLSIGGWTGSEGFSDAALTPASRARFVDSAMDLAIRYQLDGLDIDWEFPVTGGDAGTAHRPEDGRNFSLLLKDLRAAMNRLGGRRGGQRLLLTAALGNNPNYVRHVDMRSLSRLLDWGNVMAYDFAGPWDKVSGHLAPLLHDPQDHHPLANPAFNVTTLVDTLIGTGMKPRQLVLGVPLYGYSWTGCHGMNDQQRASCTDKGPGTWEAGTLDIADIEAHYRPDAGYTEHWNARNHASLLRNSDATVLISYESERSLTDKLAFMRRRHLGGIMVWELSNDAHSTMLSQIHRAMSSPTATAPIMTAH